MLLKLKLISEFKDISKLYFSIVYKFINANYFYLYTI